MYQVFSTLCFLLFATTVTASPSVWTWLSGSTNEALDQLKKNSDIVDMVSFGGFSVSSDLKFTKNCNLTLLNAIHDLKMEPHPLIGGSNIDTLRQLFANVNNSADAFISDATSTAVSLKLSGYNIDFEPYNQGSTYADGIAFAAFADKFAKELHKHGMKLSIDYFSNLPFWNLGALNTTTEVDTLISMDTYVPSNVSFEIYYNIASNHIDSKRLGVGICTGIRPSPFTPYGPDPCGIDVWTKDQVNERIEFVLTNDITQINLWVLPISDIWWNGLRIMKNSSVQEINITINN